MKKAAIPFFILLLLFSVSCKNKSSQSQQPVTESQKETNTKSSSEIDTKKSGPSDAQMKAYKPKNQKNIKIRGDEGYLRKHVLKDSENSFNVNDNIIKVVIPNSDEKMEIIDVFNVSNYENNNQYNAIVIHMSNGSDDYTKDEVTHKLEATLFISKINGLKKEKLQNGNLKVYVINEDVIDDEERSYFKKCALMEEKFSHLECDLRCGELYESEEKIGAECKNTVQTARPREQEGDIIIGG